MSSWLVLSACRDNARLASHFWLSSSLRIPVLLLWVAVFGGSLHAPVTTYFYISVGASTDQVGNIGAIISGISMVTAPLYGSLIDARGAYPAIAAAGFCCAFGCAIRALATSVEWLYVGSCVLGLGAASLLPSVLAHVSSQTADATKRAGVVGALAFQASALRLAGKSLYAPMSTLLEALGMSLEWRYRVMMGLCPFFCIFGWCALTLCGHARRATSGADAAAAATSANERADANNVKGDFAADDSGGESVAPRASRWPFSFVAAAGSIAATAAARQSGVVLWPLYVRDRFGWGASEFAAALLAENVGSIGALFILPALAARVGDTRLAIGLAAASAALAAIAFQLGESALHVACMVALLSLLAMLDSGLRSLGSLCVAPPLQGRAFAYLGVLTSLGSVAGNLATRLYDAEAYSVGADDGRSEDGATAAAAANAAPPATASVLPLLPSSPLLPACGLLLAACAALLAFRVQLERRSGAILAIHGRLSPPVSPEAPRCGGLVEDASEAETAVLLHKAAGRPPFAD